MTRDERIEAAFSAYNHALARLGRQIRPRDFLGAIIDAAYPELAAGTHWIAPREMTMEMREAAEELDEGTTSAVYCAGAEEHWAAARDAYLKQEGEKP